MDRAIAPEITKRKRNRNIFIILLIIVCFFVCVFLFRNTLKTSLKASNVATAVAELGSVENTFEASGEVIPAHEQIITSPIKASIRRILLKSGAKVQPGQAILELDKSLTYIEYEKSEDQLSLKRNNIEQLRMRLNKNLHDAELNDSIKLLNINRLKADLEDMKRLYQVGGRTQEEVTRAENALRIAELEKKQLENDLSYNRQSMSASLRESALEAQIEEKNLKELQHKLKMADIIADQSGVLTWVNENVGSAVNEDDMLAKIADLASFRIDGSCSDVYADRLKIGLPVIVKINDSILRGEVIRVKPAVKNGVVQFVVQLNDDHHTSLRPNMKVEVFVVYNRKSRTVRVANGPAFKGRRKQYVYVLKDGVAIRREVEIGLTNFDYVEVTSGLQSGEKIILTDMSQYEHLEIVKVE